MPFDGSFDLLTMAEVAKLLHVSKAHVCNIAAGRVQGCTQLPVLHLGRRMLVRRDSLVTWIQNNEVNDASRKRDARDDRRFA